MQRWSERSTVNHRSCGGRFVGEVRIRLRTATAAQSVLALHLFSEVPNW